MTTTSFGDRVDRWILKKGFRAQRPLSSLRAIEARRFAARPMAFLEARRTALTVTAGSPWVNFISRDSGYKLFAPDTIPHIPLVVATCNAVYRRRAAELANPVNKRYFFNLLSVADLRQHAVLVDFALSAPFTEAVTGYLGQVPRLNSIGVFYSSVNDTTAGSQMFHVDGDALSQIKGFVNVWDVTPGGGEFTFVPKGRTTQSLRRGGLLKTISDKDLAEVMPESEQIRLFGRPGTGVLCDTSRCLHQGSRARERPRLVFQFQYVSRPDALVVRASSKPVPGGHLSITREIIDGLNLANPKAMLFVD